MIAEPTAEGRLQVVQRLDDRQAERTASALDFIQSHGRPVAYEQLLIARDRVFEQFRSGLKHLRRKDTEAATWEFEIALSTWLLYWRLYLDQTKADLVRRFGKRSIEVQGFAFSCSDAFEASSSYRIVEGLRDMVAHSRRIRARPFIIPVMGIDYHGYNLTPGELLQEFDFRKYAKADLLAHRGALPVDSLVNESMSALTQVARWSAALDIPTLQSAAVYLSERTDGCSPKRVIVVGEEEQGFVERAWTRTPEPVRLLIQEHGRTDRLRQYGSVRLDGSTVSPTVGSRVMVNFSPAGLRRTREELYAAERMGELNGQIGTVVKSFDVAAQGSQIALSFDPYPRSWKSEDLLDATYAQTALGLGLQS